MLCISGLMDDVMFVRNGPCGDVWLAALRYRVESDVYECLVLIVIVSPEQWSWHSTPMQLPGFGSHLEPYIIHVINKHPVG